MKLNPTIRILLIVGMLASLGLILWFPINSVPGIVGYAVITIGMWVVWWSTVKNKQKK